MKLITIASKTLKVVVSTLGAELQSITDKDGRERLWQGDVKNWSGHAPILFPVAGGFRDDCYDWMGKRYHMPKHGFVRRLEWQVENVSSNEVVFLMQEKNEGFPFVYDLRAIFIVEGSTLSISYTVTNHDIQPFYFSIGSHEGYSIPEGLESYEIVFDEYEKLEVYPLIGNLISRTPWLLSERTRTLAFKDSYFAVDAMVFLHLKSHGVTLRSNLHERTIRVEFPDYLALLFWNKPGAGFVAIEPWHNGPDFIDADYAIENKPGFMLLKPEDTRTLVHTITIGG